MGALSINIDGDEFALDVVRVHAVRGALQVAAQRSGSGCPVAGLCPICRAQAKPGAQRIPTWIVRGEVDRVRSFFPDATDYARNVMGAGCYKVGPGYRGCLGGAVNLWDGIMYQGKSLLAIKEELKAESQTQKKAKTKKK